MFTTFKRVIKSGWLSFFRDGGLATATIFALVLTICLFTLLFLFQEVSRFLTSFLQERADISVYFQVQTLEKDIFNLQEEISKIPEVKAVKYVSREEALSRFIERHKDNPVLMESLAEVGNPFLAVLNIQAFRADQYQLITNFLETPPYKDMIEKVDYYQRKPVIERIFFLTSTINRWGIFLSLILAVLAILVTFNTIRLAIYNSREEIKIQRLVGASNWFIRGPFIILGAISGIFAALISLLISTLISWIVSPKISALLPGLNIFQFFINNFWLIFFIQISIGIFLGIISSSLAIRKYLKT